MPVLFYMKIDFLNNSQFHIGYILLFNLQRLKRNWKVSDT